MCLAVPGRVVELGPSEPMLVGKVDFGGVRKVICLDHVRDVKVGDYVLVHVGFALQRIDEAAAQKVLDDLRLLGELGEAQAL